MSAHQSQGATDRTMGLSVLPDRTGTLQVTHLRGDGATRDLESAIRTERLGRRNADRLDSRQVRWLRAVQDILKAA